MTDPVDNRSTQPNSNTTAMQAELFSRAVRALLLALGIVVAIFVLYEIVERTWLVNTDMRILHVLHIVRGISSSVLTASVVGWSILRASQPLLVAEPFVEERPRQVHVTDEQRIVNYARWFIVMRWITVLVAATLVVIVVKIVSLLPEQVWWPLLATIVVLAGSNIVYTGLLRWGLLIHGLLPLQVYADLLILTALLHFSGGIENPLFLIMIFHVVIGGIILSRPQCYTVALVASLLFALLACAEGAELLNHYTLLIFPHFAEEEGTLHAAHQPLYVATIVGLQAMVLFLSAYFVTTLTERLRHEERRLEAMADRAMAERRLLDQSLETTGTGLRVLSQNLQSSWANNQWKAWFASSTGIGKDVLKKLNGEGSAAQRTLQDGLVRAWEIVIDDGEDRAKPPTLSETGQQRAFQVTTAPLHDSDGNITQVVELAQDITQQKKAQAQLMRAGQLAAVGELAGQVAHEVNNPIGIISAKARLLLSDHKSEMSPKVAGELTKFTELCDRIARITQGLLSYCRRSVGVRTPLDIRIPIQKALALVDQRARGQGIDIHDDLPADLPLLVANANEMEQVFLNLVLNAIDAMPKGGRLQVSTLRPCEPLRDGRMCLAVVVADTGAGIPEDIREHIFEPFFTTKQEGRGTGLGLSICQGLIASHGGEIDVDSRPGHGTRFIVKLPIERRSSVEEPSHEKDTHPGRG